MEFNTDVFSQFDKKWALLSAGPKDDHNTMTISWGSMGTLWHKPAVTVYVRPTRFTHKFMNDYEYFTVSFLPDDKREAYKTMGTVTGRHKTDMPADVVKEFYTPEEPHTLYIGEVIEIIGK